MDRSQKSESVASLNAVFNEVGVVVITRNLGMTVAQSTDLRTKMRLPVHRIRLQRTVLPSLPSRTRTTLASVTFSPVRRPFPPRSIRSRRQRPWSSSRRPTTRSKSLVVRWVRSFSTPMASRLSPRCPRWTNCAAPSSGLSRLRQRRSLSSRPLRRPSWPASSALTPRQLEDFQTIFPGHFPRPQFRSKSSWPISPSLLKNFRS